MFQATSSLGEKRSKGAGLELQKAWLLRWNQRIDEAMMLFAKILADNRWENLSVDNLGGFALGEERENYLDALLLKASFLRAQGQLQKSSALFRRILSKNSELMDVAGFRLQFELGLDCWRREDLSSAMESFLLAERKASNSYERLFALMNLLLCLESLDLQRKFVERKMEFLLNEFNQASEMDKIFNVVEQWRAYWMRQNFYQKMEVPNDDDASGQGAFFQDWVTELPYIGTSSIVDKKMEDTYLWQWSYRMRTLRGVWSPSDRSLGRVADGIDRLYLWVWKWMASDEISAEKVLWTLESVLEQLELESQSRDDLLLLRNACTWLVNLLPELGRKFKSVLPKLQRLSGENYPLLDTEYFLILGLFNHGQENVDLPLMLKRFECFANIYQRPMMLPRLGERIAYLNDQNADAKAFYACVDLIENKVSVPSKNKTIRSSMMAKLIASMDQKKSCDIGELSSTDDIRQVYNLVERVKKIFPKKSLKIENGQVRRGQGWPSIKIMSSLLESDSVEVKFNEDFNSQRLKFVGSEAHLTAAKALLSHDFDRKELEKALNISKATACRMISEWTSQNILERKGMGKATRYSWIKEG